jgi:hypothetical protein
MENEIALELANKKGASALGLGRWEEKIQFLQTKLVASSDRLDTCTKNVNYYIEKMSNLSNQINNTDPKNTELKTNYNLYKGMYEEAVKKQEAAIKEIQALSNTNDPDILKSDLSELFNNFIDNYRDFLSTLSSEQMVIVFNIIGYFTLLMILTSITTLLIGDQLINILKLETKYPKIAKYIKFKQTLNKYYLRFYIVLFYILLFILISVNIFFFSYDYFL